ncbi:MAG: M42 family metallopeptidase [Nanoarchaeota archaeon]|nr:M42 family metallopeptidase [Nanoarchaeota archaeon]
MKLLKELATLPGPSGSEQIVRDFIHKEIKKYVDEVKVDKFGNLVARKIGKGAKVILTAHMDEIGLMVNYVNPDGKMDFTRIGGIDPITLVGQQVEIVPNKGKIIHGVVTSANLHESRDSEEAPKASDLYIDAGVDKKALEKAGVSTGCYIVPKSEFLSLGNDKVFSCKALDDRIGCYVLIEIAKRLKEISSDLYYVFTVQEEVGLYGAQTSVYDINPDWGVAVDVTVATDSEEPRKMILGNGPNITIMDSEMIANKCLNAHIKMLAKKHKIPLQEEVVESGTTDATKIMMSRGGVPSTVIGVPVRNMHSTISIANMDDIKNIIKLLEALMKDPPKICLV